MTKKAITKDIWSTLKRAERIADLFCKDPRYLSKVPKDHLVKISFESARLESALKEIQADLTFPKIKGIKNGWEVYDSIYTELG